MIRFGISEKAVESAKDAKCEASARLNKAEVSFSVLLKNHATRDKIEESKALDNLSECENLYREAALVATAMRAARNGQIENEIRRALLDHADELDGKPAHYKRTASLIKTIVADALQVDASEVHAWNTYHFSFKITCFGAELELYVGNGDFEAESVRNSARPKDDGRDDLTPAKVRRLVAQRAKAAEKLRKAAEKYQAEARAAIEKYRCIDDSDFLSDCAKVNI